MFLHQFQKRQLSGLTRDQRLCPTTELATRPPLSLPVLGNYKKRASSLSHVPIPTLTTTPVSLASGRKKSTREKTLHFFLRKKRKKDTCIHTQGTGGHERVHLHLQQMRRYDFKENILLAQPSQHSWQLNPALRYVKTKEVVLIKSQSVLSLQAQKFLTKLKINLTSLVLHIYQHCFTSLK